jgi:hypothetical protein
MRVRILLTDGSKTEDLYWLRHNGHEVTCGRPDDHWHVSYPKHDRIRLTRVAPVVSRRFTNAPPMPLTHFTGHRELIGFSLPPTPGLGPPFQRQSEDIIVFVDVRSLPADRLLWVFVGLVAPGMLDSIEYEPDVEIRQLLVARVVTPWVYVAVGSATTPMSASLGQWIPKGKQTEKEGA